MKKLRLGYIIRHLSLIAQRMINTQLMKIIPIVKLGLTQRHARVIAEVSLVFAGEKNDTRVIKLFRNYNCAIIQNKLNAL